MKLQHYLILAILFILNYNNVSAQVFIISPDNRTITVSGNCSIPVESFAPKDVNIYGNREKGGVGRKNNIPIDLFAKNTTSLNQAPKGVSFRRADNGVATVDIDHSQINDKTIIKFFQAKTDPNKEQQNIIDWIPDGENTFQVTIIKSKLISNKDIDVENSDMSFSGNQTNRTDQDSQEIDNIKKKLYILDHKVDELRYATRGSINGDHDILFIIIALLIGLHIGGFLFYQNRKSLKELSKENSDMKNSLEKLEREMKNILDKIEKRMKNQESHLQTTLEKNREEHSISDEKIKSFIKEQIKIIQTQFALTASPSTMGTNPDINLSSQSINTDNVKYHQDGNCFSLEQTEIKIFRIYYRDGEYYYTIVDDSAVREELIGMLQIFEGCITYQATSGVAKRVEPVTEGKLRKDGDKFYVDANNKLVVKFV